jgi:BlaI family penicillinase repressor
MSDPRPTDGELAILQVLWSLGAPATVRDVHDRLSRTKDTAYTTVLKMLTIMAEKGLVRRDESERSHRYRPAYAEPVVQSSLLKNFMRNTFEGSALKLVQSALDSNAATGEELDAIARLIADAKARAQAKPEAQ